MNWLGAEGLALTVPFSTAMEAWALSVEGMLTIPINLAASTEGK